MNIRKGSLVAVASIALTACAHKTEVTVHNLSELHAAADRAKGGDTIWIAPGLYNFFLDEKPHKFTSTVTFTALDRNNPPVIAGLNIGNWSHATWSYLTVTHSIDQNAVIDSGDNSAVGFDHLNADGQGNGGSVVVISGNCHNCSITNSKLHGERNGVGVSGGEGPVLIAGNDIFGILENGIFGSGGTSGKVNNLTISNNIIHDFVDPHDGSHADAIQIERTHNGPPDIVNLKIKGNYIYLGNSGFGMQEIFVHNDQNSGMKFRNADIEDNAVCMGGQFNGLFMDGAVGAKVLNNYIVGVPGWSLKVHLRDIEQLEYAGNQSNMFDDVRVPATGQANKVVPQGAGCAPAEAWWRARGGSVPIPSAADMSRSMMPIVEGQGHLAPDPVKTMKTRIWRQLRGWAKAARH